MGGLGAYLALYGLPPISCVFHDVTGLPCLTCGSTRALRAIAAGNFAAAFRLNPLCAAVWAGYLIYIPYGLIVSVARLPRVRFILSRHDWFVLRFLIPAIAMLNWAWLIWDKR